MTLSEGVRESYQKLQKCHQRQPQVFSPSFDHKYKSAL